MQNENTGPASTIISWYSNNFLLANPEKFQSLNINPRKLDKDKSDITLSINDLAIANTELIKLLGVHIDENLNFTEHISKLCIKASQKAGVVSRLRNLIPCKAKLLLYKSLILPYLTHCHLTWHFCKSSDKIKLERLQERALRVIYKSQSATYEELLRRADVPSLYNRRLQDITVLMYKVKHNLVPDCVSSAKALHTRYGIVTLYYHVLKLFAMASTLLDISGRSYGQNSLEIKGIRQVYVFS